MNDSTEIIVAPAIDEWKPTIGPVALQARDTALSTAALIGRVENAAQNEAAVRAHIELKQIASGFERARKKLKEPLLEAGRLLDRTVNAALLDVEKEIGRISALTGAFQVAEQRRVAEEQRLQQEELARIEREKQAELYRIQREEEARQAEARRSQEEADRKAREAQEAAQRAASEATNKAQRESARLAQIEADKQAQAAAAERERLAKEAEEARQRAAAEFQAAQERAQVATFAEAKPITTTRAAGQVTKADWDIEVTNPYELAKYHPDCVKIEPLMLPIKQQLNAGMTIKGIRANRKLTSTVRAGQMSAAIEV